MMLHSLVMQKLEERGIVRRGKTGRGIAASKGVGHKRSALYKALSPRDTLLKPHQLLRKPLRDNRSKDRFRKRSMSRMHREYWRSFKNTAIEPENHHIRRLLHNV